MKHPEGHRWHIFKQLVFRTYGDSCHICGCGGARQIDHLEPITENMALAWELKNCRPSHGAPRNPCSLCSQKAGKPIFCNQIRGMGSVERARRIIAEKIAAHKAGEARPTDTPRVRAAFVPREDPGRVW